MSTTTEMLARSTNRMARRFAVDAADGRKDYAINAVATAETMVMWLRELDVPPNQIDDLCKMLVDILGDVQGKTNKLLDNEGEETDQHQVDISDLMPTPPDESLLFGDIRRLRVQS